MSDYNAMELMVVVAARSLPNAASVVVGTGAPCAAAMLAQKTHAPDLVVMFEAGGLGPKMRSAPVSVGETSRVIHGVGATEVHSGRISPAPSRKVTATCRSADSGAVVMAGLP